MTALDQTRHCPMCEDAAKKILELEQRVKVLTDALRIIMDDQRAEENRYVFLTAKHALNQTPQQTAAQIERGHVEWLGEPYGYLHQRDGRMPDFHFRKDSHKSMIAVYVIPPLPKESNSPETDLDEALRRQ